MKVGGILFDAQWDANRKRANEWLIKSVSGEHPVQNIRRTAEKAELVLRENGFDCKRGKTKPLYLYYNTARQFIAFKLVY